MTENVYFTLLLYLQQPVTDIGSRGVLGYKTIDSCSDADYFIHRSMIQLLVDKFYEYYANIECSVQLQALYLHFRGALRKAYLSMAQMHLFEHPDCEWDFI